MDSRGFKNEPQIDWTIETNRVTMLEALGTVANNCGEYPFLIDGKAFRGEQKIESFDPADNRRCVGIINVPSEEQIELAGKIALQAVVPNAEKRIEILKIAASKLRDKKFELAAWIVYEVSKPWNEALAEINEAIDFCELYAIAAAAYMEKKKYQGWICAEENFIFWRSRGPTAAISTWNFPVSLSVEKIAASFAAGCPILYKPAEQSPVTGWKVVECFLESGVPENMLAYLPGRKEVGAALVKSPYISQITFTGSREVGEKIKREASRYPGKFGIKEVDAEMGGNNPIIVSTSAILDLAIKGIVESKFGFNGQKCSALQRLIVIGDRPELKQKLVEAAASLEFGHPENPRYRHTALIDKEAFSRYNTGITDLERFRQPVFKRYSLTQDNGWFVCPVIFDGVPNHRIQREIFGPALFILRTENFQEAVCIANDTDYALTAGVYTEYYSEIHYALEHLKAGNLYINRKITGAVVGRQPFGGFKYSGTGGKKVGLVERLEFFMVPVSTSINKERHGVLV